MFMLDTNAFNRALDSGIDPSVLSRCGRLFVTHIQLNELQATKRTERLDQLLAVFTSMEPEKIPTAAAVWSVSEWGEAEWGSANGGYDAILADLDKRNGKKKNNAQDILIAVTALNHRLTLVTDDASLSSVFRKFGGTAESFDEFLRHAR